MKTLKVLFRAYISRPEIVIGGEYEFDDITGNPFADQPDIVTVKDIKKGWVLYARDRCGYLFEASLDITSFRICYKPVIK